MSFNGTGVSQYISEVASREGTTRADIAQRIKKGQTFMTRHGASLSFKAGYIVSHDPSGIPTDMILINDISGGRRKKRHITKKVRRTRRRSSRKN
jgi:hypothetical protein